MEASSLDTDSVNQRRNTARVDPLTSDGGICHSFAVKIHAIDRYFPTAVKVRLLIANQNHKTSAETHNGYV